ncbi:MAG: hypothetical protein IPH77_11235 [Ignavibacteria bacterium]|nr:hypothetical protein [Ignavibacteria bacterium]
MILPVLFWAGLSPYVIFVIVSPAVVAFGAFLGMNYFIAALILVALILLMFKRNIFLTAGILVMNFVIGFSVDTLYKKLHPISKQN